MDKEISDVLDGNIIAIDGKTLRGSGHKRVNKSDDTETNAGIALKRMKAALSVRYIKTVIVF